MQVIGTVRAVEKVRRERTRSEFDRYIRRAVTPVPEILRIYTKEELLEFVTSVNRNLGRCRDV